MDHERPVPEGRAPDRRFPRWVYGVGAEPDARFTLANERTFLAWARTGLALLAGGVALEALGLPVEPALRLAAAVVLIALGTLAPAVAWWGWSRAERAMRRGDPLPAPVGFGLLVGGVAVAGVLVLLGLLHA
ncbi:YidH family protein [Cellulomonas dongxiuzhuiae]|uniref:DUF202 domain-containing protein n=1 Tax=Cellulomonas dongxiuzhuiae TaxID=2819979 RepID=A0ABX8GME4_9CELL|nr:DUF202 domain-containing protein [Cellulomonas dongxiuzhuiae]MBO3095791.1 DUF202 domain-containing protein [Cellulomonas dongxiuzhuiae]QWC17103.1 DUF202 domain-containing protein [Cellulomonas dongxiuzhuiae]